MSTYGYDARNGTLRLLDMQATLPAGWSGANLSAEIRLHPDATALYVSNRGHDSIAVFALDPHTGLPAARADVPTESCPRAFSLSDDGRHLLVAGQKSAGATLYRVGADGIGLAPWHSIPVGANPMGVELLAIAQG